MDTRIDECDGPKYCDSLDTELQVYIAVVNYTLMVLTLIIVATFKSSVKIGRAYGADLSTLPLPSLAFVVTSLEGSQYGASRWKRQHIWCAPHPGHRRLRGVECG